MAQSFYSSYWKEVLQHLAFHSSPSMRRGLCQANCSTCEDRQKKTCRIQECLENWTAQYRKKEIILIRYFAGLSIWIKKNRKQNLCGFFLFIYFSMCCCYSSSVFICLGSSINLSYELSFSIKLRWWCCNHLFFIPYYCWNALSTRFSFDQQHNYHLHSPLVI